MAKKPQNSYSPTNLLIDRIIAEANAGPTKERNVVDIITFCEDSKYLNFLNQDPPIQLWQMQRIVLKLLYRGTRGNENIFLTDDEINYLREIAKTEDLDYDKEKGGFEQVIDKYYRGEIITTLLLVMGRRSSKTMMVSIIAAYEAYKLCETPEGNPHKYYNISPDKPIHIINCAVSEPQALDPLFLEIKSRILRSPYFLDKVNHACMKEGFLPILTDADKRENARRLKEGITDLVEGSVILRAACSNSASIRGKAAICILFDEFAHFLSSQGKSSGDEVYNALTPSATQFGKDKKIVLLSDPRGKDGMFWKLFNLAQEREKIIKDDVVTYKYKNDDILAIQIPTWRMNPQEDFSRAVLEAKEKAKDPGAFATAFAARFMGSEGNKYFDINRIDQCIDCRLSNREFGEPGIIYYAHLDPATKDHNYALVLVHAVPFQNSKFEIRRKIIVDHIKYWTPDESGPVSLIEVKNYILQLNKRFRIAQVSFDTFQSAQTIEELKMHSIRAVETQFNSWYKNEIFGELRHMINEGDIMLPPHERLIGEMKELMFRLTARGIDTYPDKKSLYVTDDCVDALASAAYQAIRMSVTKALPKSALTYFRR